MLNEPALPGQVLEFISMEEQWRSGVPREFSRGRRVADLIQRELALLVQQEVEDPRIGMITISDTTVSRDFAVSDVYFTVLPERDATAVEEVLNQSAGFLRFRLAKILNIRSTPKLRFHYDSTMNTGIRLSQSIDKAIAQDCRRGTINDPADNDCVEEN